MKKLLTVFLLACVLMAIAAPTLLGYAAEPDLLKSIKQEIKKTDYNLDVREIKEVQLKKYNSDIENKLNQIGFFEEIGSDYTQTHLPTAKTFLFTDKDTKEEAILTQRLYSDSEGNDVFVQVIYLPQTDFLLSVQSNRISNDGKVVDNFFEETELDSLTPVSPGGISTYAVQLPSFPSWLSWMGATLACSVYCGGLGLIAIPVGVVCSVVCGGMFHVACAGY